MAMRVEPARHEERNLAGFVIECKDFRTLSMFFLYPEPVKALTNLFKQHICPQQILYAFLRMCGVYGDACACACAFACACACACVRVRAH